MSAARHCGCCSSLKCVSAMGRKLTSWTSWTLARGTLKRYHERLTFPVRKRTFCVLFVEFLLEGVDVLVRAGGFFR